MKVKYFLLALCASASHLQPLSAATVAYWDMQGTAGSNVSSLVDSSGNALHGAGVAVNNGAVLGLLPKYDSQSVGPTIFDPISGTYSSASTSIRFTNTGLPSANNTIAGSQIKVTNSSLLNLQNFTVEGFIKMNTIIDYATIVGRVREGSNPTYNLDTAPLASHALRLRSDHNVPGSAFSNGVPGWNQGITSTSDGVLSTDQWYHIAFTFQEGNAATSTPGNFQMYLNGANVTSGSGNLNAGEIYQLIYDNGDLLFGSQAGGRAFDGWMSHFRISDTVLSTNQFLQIVPEPSASALCSAALACFMMQRRRLL